MQFLVEEAFGTALELEEAGQIVRDREQAEQTAAIGKSHARLEQALNRAAG